MARETAFLLFWDTGQLSVHQLAQHPTYWFMALKRSYLLKLRFPLSESLLKQELRTLTGSSPEWNS